MEKEKRYRWLYILTSIVFAVLFLDYAPLGNYVFGLFLCIWLFLNGLDK